MKEYEKIATDKLKKVFDKEIINVISIGKEDSTKADIIISASNSGQELYLEVKMPNSQTSQFVIEIQEDKFVYGFKNKYENNSFSQTIINHMNDNFQKYSLVSQSGIEIPISEELINNWIISNLKNKQIKYIYSGTINDEKIIPIDKFGDYFEAKAYFRRKKSGSRKLPANKIEDFKKSFNSKLNYIPEIIIINNKSYIYSKKGLKKKSYI